MSKGADRNETKSKRRELTYDDRYFIQSGLDIGKSVATIARALDRSHEVIASEIKRNRTREPSFPVPKTRRNVCKHRDICKETNVCNNGCKKGVCRKCPDFKCNSACKRFKPEPCAKLGRTPFCCNFCRDLVASRDCGCAYLFYDAAVAEAAAKERRSERRKGHDATPETVEMVRKVAYECIVKKKQSPEHVIAAHPELGISASTLRRWINEGLLKDVFRLDLPFACKRRQHKAPKGKYASNAVPRKYLEGRTIQDWNALSEAEKASTVELDTVLGLRTNKQCLLSLQWPAFCVQVYMLLESHTSDEVVAAFDAIQSVIGLDEFRRIFPIIKTDRGTEFANAPRIECDEDGNQRCRLYYCDSYKSQQKGHIERGHEELRRILPKEVSDFDKLRKQDMPIIVSHINSMPRPKLFMATPYSLAKAPLGVLFDALSIGYIPAADSDNSRLLVPHAMIPGTEPIRQMRAREAS